MNRLPLCARIGVLHGLIIGFLFSLMRIQAGFVALAAHEIIWSVLVFSTLALLCSLFILIVVERYLGGAVFWPAAINAILVGLLTILVINLLLPNRFFVLLGIWIGMVIGLFVGFVLCRLCLDRLIANREAGDNYGR